MSHERSDTMRTTDDPTLAGLHEDREAVRREEADRLREAVEGRADVQEVRAAAPAAVAGIEAFIAELGPTVRARREALRAPELARFPALAPVRQRVLDELDAIESLFVNAPTMRKAAERLATLSLEEAQPSGADGPFVGSIVATMVARIRAGIETPGWLQERWTAHQETWAQLGRLRAAQVPGLAPGNSQSPAAELPDRPALGPRRAKGSLS